MFTGIIKEIGILKKKTPKTFGASLVISTKLRTKPGNSICVNGACLTVTKKFHNGFEADIIPETLACTNLGRLRIGAKLNLEPSMRMKDDFDGHFVTGHIDSVATVLKKGTFDNGALLTIKIPKNLACLVAKKGSIAINGVSLTIADVKGMLVTVALIPFTQKHTNLSELRSGDIVNVEVDLIARYVYKLTTDN